MTQSDPRLTVTLTGRRPVSILKAEWPIIAKAEHRDLSEYVSKLFVRKHREEERALVYGFWKGGSSQRGGELLETDDPEAIEAAVLRVGQALEFDYSVISQCLAALPAEKI